MTKCTFKKQTCFALFSGLYLNYSGGVDRKYFQQVSPKGVAFSIVWPIIYLWNLAGIVYVLVSLWLPEVKSPVKLQPTLISKVRIFSNTLYGGIIGFLAGTLQIPADCWSELY